MIVNLSIEDVGKTWVFGNEQVWQIKSNGKSYAYYSSHKPVIGSYIPCDVIERPGTTSRGTSVTFRDARPLPAQQTAPQPQTAQPMPTPSRPEKPCLTGVVEVIQTVLGQFTKELRQDEPSSLQAICSVICTTLIAYADGRIAIDVSDPVPQDVKDAYRQGADGHWPGGEE